MAQKARTTARKPTAPKTARHVASLEELRDATAARLQLATDDYRVLRDDSVDDGSADDDGGGEADVTFAERDRLRAAIEVEQENLESLEASIVRAARPDWHLCVTCGKEIGAARLEALPGTDRCVQCKAAAW